MSATVSLTETQIFTATRACLLSMLPVGVEVIRSQVNRVSMPKGPDFVVLTPLMRERLAQNTHAYDDGGVVDGVTQSGFKNATQPLQMTIQCDIYGPNSAENAAIITTLWRDEFACEAFTAAGIAAQPVDATDAHQAPLINAEMQYEARWTTDLMLQCNITIGTAMTFADKINIQPVDVATAYPVGVQ